jgi:DNA-binding NarL/FixJ family response regulator
VVLGPPSAAGRLRLAGPSFAWAYLARDAEPRRIVAAVRAVAAGLVALDPEFATSALGSQATGPLPGASEADELTAREREVLTLVAIGLTNKAIAQRLSISDHTVKFHVASLLAKLDAESRTEAVHVAARRGLLTL